MKYYTICRNPIKRIELIRLAINAGMTPYKDDRHYTPHKYEQKYPASSFFVFSISPSGLINVGNETYENHLLDNGHTYIRPEQFKEIFLKEIQKKEVKEITQEADYLKTKGNLKSIEYTLNQSTKELIITTTYQLK